MALKVYRTPVGFHDAYVAAPSQKAALAAWGATVNLFARGVAEVVTDPALTAEPLTKPGEVIKRLRAMPDEPTAAAHAKQKPRKAAPAAPRAPRPDRSPIDKAEAVLAEAEAAHRAAEQELAAAEKALAERRRALQKVWIAERDRLEVARDEAEETYAAALRRWQEG